MVNIQPNSNYALINAKAGTCMDLSGADDASIIGFQFHRGSNQMWSFENAGQSQTFNIKSAGLSKYLSLAGEPRDGQKVVAADAPFAWRVDDEQGVDSGVRLLPANNTGFCVDLSRHGDSAQATPVELWGRWEGQNQVWKMQQVQ